MNAITRATPVAVLVILGLALGARAADLPTRDSAVKSQAVLLDGPDWRIAADPNNKGRVVTADLAGLTAARILCDRNLLQEPRPASDIHIERHLHGIDPFLFAGCYHGVASWFGGMMGSMTPSGNRIFIQSTAHLRRIGGPAVPYDRNPSSRPADITKGLGKK